MSTSWESILVKLPDEEIDGLPAKVMTLCDVISPAIKLIFVAFKSASADSIWSIEIQGIGKNSLGLTPPAANEVKNLFDATNNQLLIDYCSRSALFYLSTMISKLGIDTNWVLFSDATGESMQVEIVNGDIKSSELSLDTDQSGFIHTALKPLNEVGIEASYLEDYFEEFYELHAPKAWLLMEKKEKLNQPDQISD